jgi:homoserine kinase
LLGAAFASNSADLFEAALDDRLHEPYRANSSPLLAVVRGQLPAAALGATLSGAGPTVIVWARNGKADTCADELRQRFPNEQVLPLTISPTGAGPT